MLRTVHVKTVTTLTVDWGRKYTHLFAIIIKTQDKLYSNNIHIRSYIKPDCNDGSDKLRLDEEVRVV